MKKEKTQKQPKYNCKPQDIVFDIKTALLDIYNADFIECDDKLKVQFYSGENFIIKVEERKKL